MGKLKHWRGMILVLTAIIMLGVSYFDETESENKNKEHALYSVILYEHTDNEWSTLMEGIDQAEKDFDVDVHYVTMGYDYTAEDQMNLIRREIRSGAKGLLIAAVDSEMLGQYLQDSEVSVPFVTVESGLESTVPHTELHISADNYKMGEMLGQKIIEDMKAYGRKEPVAVIKEFTERDSVNDRYQGLMDTLRRGGIEVADKSRQEGDFSLSLYIGNVMREYRYIATVDKYATEEAAKAWDQYNYEFDRTVSPVKNPVMIYGIGNTAQTVSDLDSGKLAALVYQNEFNIGYNGIRALTEKIKNGYVKEEYNIMSKLVTRNTLYESENERLLFSNQ